MSSSPISMSSPTATTTTTSNIRTSSSWSFFLNRRTVQPKPIIHAFLTPTDGKTQQTASATLASSGSFGNTPSKYTPSITSYATPTKASVNHKSTDTRSTNSQSPSGPESTLPGSVAEPDSITIEFDPEDVDDMVFTPIAVAGKQIDEFPVPTSDTSLSEASEEYDMFDPGISLQKTPGAQLDDDSADPLNDSMSSRRGSMNSSSSSSSSLQGTPLLTSTPSAVGTLASSPSKDALSAERSQEASILAPRCLDFSDASSPQTVVSFPQTVYIHSTRSFEGTLPLPKRSPVEHWRSRSFSGSSPLRIPSHCKTITHLMPRSPDFREEPSQPAVCIHWDETLPVHQVDPSYETELLARLNRIKQERQKLIRGINKLDQTESEHLDVLNHERQSSLRKYRAESMIGRIGPSARHQLKLSYQLGNLRDVRAEYAMLRIEDLKQYPVNMNGMVKTQRDRINEIWRHYDEVTKPFEGRTVYIDVAIEMQAKKEQEEAEKEAQAQVLEFYRYSGIDIKKRAQHAFIDQAGKVRQVNAFYAQASELEKELQPLEKELQALLNSSIGKAKSPKALTKQLKPLKTQLKNLKTQIQEGHLIVQELHPHFTVFKKEWRNRDLDLISLAEYSENLVKNLDSRIGILKQRIANIK